MKLVNDIKSLKEIIGFPSKYSIITYLKYISEKEIVEFNKKLKINNNQNIKKTVYQNPFSDNSETTNSTKLDNISIKKSINYFINEEDAAPSFSEGISNNNINSNINMNPNKESIKIYDSFFNNMNPNIYNNKESIKIYDSIFYNNNKEDNKIEGNSKYVDNKIKNNNIDNNIGCQSIIYKTPENNPNLNNIDNNTQSPKNKSNFSISNNISKINENPKIYSSPKESKDNINIENPKIYISPKESININNNNESPKIYSSPKESINNINNNEKPKNNIPKKEVGNNFNNEIKIYDKPDNNIKNSKSTTKETENKDNNIDTRGKMKVL